MDIRPLLKALAGSEPAMLICPPWAPLRLFSSLQKRPMCAGERFHQFFCLSSCRPIAALGHLSPSRLVPRSTGLCLMGDSPGPFLSTPRPAASVGSRLGPTVPTPALLLMWTTDCPHLAMVIEKPQESTSPAEVMGVEFLNSFGEGYRDQGMCFKFVDLPADLRFKV